MSRSELGHLSTLFASISVSATIVMVGCHPPTKKIADAISRVREASGEAAVESLRIESVRKSASTDNKMRKAYAEVEDSVRRLRSFVDSTLQHRSWEQADRERLKSKLDALQTSTADFVRACEEARSGLTMGIVETIILLTTSIGKIVEQYDKMNERSWAESQRFWDESCKDLPTYQQLLEFATKLDESPDAVRGSRPLVDCERLR